MKRPILIAPRASSREILPGPDAERLLASGSWMRVIKPKPRTRDAKAMDEFRERRRQAGYRAIHVPLPPEVFEALHETKRPGETLAKLIERLLSYASTKG